MAGEIQGVRVEIKPKFFGIVLLVIGFASVGGLIYFLINYDLTFSKIYMTIVFLITAILFIRFGIGWLRKRVVEIDENGLFVRKGSRIIKHFNWLEIRAIKKIKNEYNETILIVYTHDDLQMISSSRSSLKDLLKAYKFMKGYVKRNGYGIQFLE